MKYSVRRMTPTECARLMGFADDYAKNVEIKDPSDEEIDLWRTRIDHFNKCIGKSVQPKTDKQVRKWLSDPYRDSSEYKLWGNGVAYPCADFIIERIANLNPCA